MIIGIYEYIEDFDNSDLNEYDWEEQMKEAVESYNESFGTTFNPSKVVKSYPSWKRDKQRNEQE